MNIGNIRDKMMLQNAYTCNKKRLPKVMSKNELRRFVRCIDDIRMIIVVFLGIFMGLRIGEMLRLKWEDIDFEDMVLRVLDAKNTRRYKSGYGKDRLVPVMEPFIPFLLKWQAMNPDEEYIIPYQNKGAREGATNSLTKGMIRKFQQRFTAILDKANLKRVDYYQTDGKPRYTYHSHTTRHVCGCNLRRCGLEIDKIKDYLGHAKIEDTMIYAELTKDDLHESVHIALNYPKQRNYMPQMEQPSFEAMPTQEWLSLMNENLKMMMQIKNQRTMEVQNAYMPQQTIRTGIR